MPEFHHETSSGRNLTSFAIFGIDFLYHGSPLLSKHMETETFICWRFNLPIPYTIEAFNDIQMTC